jgi:threonine dehydrogenase-like Zn-dependent dehydrogenase
MLSDIFPTGYHATELAGVQPGDSVVIYGAGPVGLMAACSATLKGASQVMVVDTHKDRLKLAEKVGAIAIDNSDGGGVEKIMDLTAGKGADRGCECVGYQCCNMHREEVPNLTMNNLVKTVKATGRIGVVGVFLPEDPQGADALAKKGQIAFDFGQFWFKGQSMGSGQANVKAYNRQLSRLIEHDKVKPSWIVSHELALEDAPSAYASFDSRKPGWTKVVLKPGKAAIT